MNEGGAVSRQPSCKVFSHERRIDLLMGWVAFTLGTEDEGDCIMASSMERAAVPSSTERAGTCDDGVVLMPETDWKGQAFANKKKCNVQGRQGVWTRGVLLHRLLSNHDIPSLPRPPWCCGAWC